MSDVLLKVNPEKKHKYGVVRLPLLHLRMLGLDVVRDDDSEEPQVSGHVVMPSLNSIDYSSNKNLVLAQMKTLADYVNAHGEFLIVPEPESN